MAGFLNWTFVRFFLVSGYNCNLFFWLYSIHGKTTPRLTYSFFYWRALEVTTNNATMGRLYTTLGIHVRTMSPVYNLEVDLLAHKVYVLF